MHRSNPLVLAVLGGLALAGAGAAAAAPPPSWKIPTAVQKLANGLTVVVSREHLFADLRHLGGLRRRLPPGA